MDYEIYATIRELKKITDVRIDSNLLKLLSCEDEEANTYLRACAWKLTKKRFHRQIYLRGIIEFSNFCKNDCFYCGLRKGNKNLRRYRLTKEEIMQCCKSGYAQGIRTFVLQSGEDKFYTDEIICDLINSIKTAWPDCAVTLSIGEKKKESYKKYKQSGADRYLLRQESSYPEYYVRLHPVTMSCEKRLQCLEDLKELGYQVGAGFMIDSPYQTFQDIICELRYMKKLIPHMVGVGPFIAHKDTPFRVFPNGSADLTLRVISVIRLMLPDALIPATTALGTLSEEKRTDAFLAGANVIMTNLTPKNVRDDYNIYDNQAETELSTLRENIESLGLQIVVDRGDHLKFRQNRQPETEYRTSHGDNCIVRTFSQSQTHIKRVQQI